MTGVTHELSFEPRDDKGSNKGDYELFLDLQSGDTVVFTPPLNWMFGGVKVYAATETGGAGKPVQTPQAKKDDIALLKQGNFSTVFANWGSNLPEGFEAVDLRNGYQGSLKYTGTTTGFYEYLVWIINDDIGNDFIDPGLRNRGAGGGS
jgi:hypothetical protein